MPSVSLQATSNVTRTQWVRLRLCHFCTFVWRSVCIHHFRSYLSFFYPRFFKGKELVSSWLPSMVGAGSSIRSPAGVLGQGQLSSLLPGLPQPPSEPYAPLPRSPLHLASFPRCVLSLSLPPVDLQPAFALKVKAVQRWIMICWWKQVLDLSSERREAKCDVQGAFEYIALFSQRCWQCLAQAILLCWMLALDGHAAHCWVIHMPW